MPEDVNARIIVTTEASAAKQGIDNVKNGLKGITDARERDLKIAQAKSQMEIAEYRSEIAAQKAYNAELQLETAEKLKQQRIKRGADDLEIQERTKRIQQFRGEVLKLQQAEATANLQAYQSKKAYESLLYLMKKNNDQRILMRLLTKALGEEMGEGNAAMARAGLVIFGVTAAVKAAKAAYELWTFSVKENTVVQSRNLQSSTEITQRLERKIAKQKEALAVVREFGDQENLTAVNSGKLAHALRVLGSEFANISVFSRNATEAVALFEKKQRETMLRNLRRDLLQTRESMSSLRLRLADEQSGIATLFMGGNGAALKTNSEISELIAKEREIVERIRELEGMPSPVEEYQQRLETVKSERHSEIEDLQLRLQILKKTNEGSEREAELLRLELEYRQKIRKLTGDELRVFKETWENEKNLRMQMFDAEQEKENFFALRDAFAASRKELAKFADFGFSLEDRIAAIKENMAIDKLVAEGREADADAMRIKVSLDREEAKLTGDMLNLFREMRPELEFQLLAQKQQTREFEEQKRLAEEQKRLAEEQKRLAEERLKAEMEAIAASREELEKFADFGFSLDDRIDRIKEEMAIEKLISEGREEDAEIMRIKVSLDREEAGLSGDILELFKERRKELEEMLALQYRQTQEIKEQQAFAEAIKEAEAAAAREQAEQLRLDEEMQNRLIGQMREAAEKRSSVLGSFYREAYKYRETAQEAIRSNSLENIRLQSRIFLNAGVSTAENPAKQSAASLKKMEKQNTDMQQVITSVLRVLNGMSANLRNIGVKAY